MSYLDSPDIDWIDAQVHTRTLDYASIAMRLCLCFTLLNINPQLKNTEKQRSSVCFTCLIVAGMYAEKHMQKLFIKEEPSSELKSRHKDKI